jgi:hypothetical protein
LGIFEGQRWWGFLGGFLNVFLEYNHFGLNLGGLVSICIFLPTTSTPLPCTYPMKEKSKKENLIYFLMLNKSCSAAGLPAPTVDYFTHKYLKKMKTNSCSKCHDFNTPQELGSDHVILVKQDQVVL